MKNGEWYGSLDNKSTTTITNIATNRVNEENQLSGGQEINNYIGVDEIGSEEKPSKPETVKKNNDGTYTYQGNKYTDEDLRKAAKQSGRTLEEYKKELNIE
jgi:hypothetical protein